MIWAAAADPYGIDDMSGIYYFLINICLACVLAYLLFFKNQRNTNSENLHTVQSRVYTALSWLCRQYGCTVRFKVPIKDIIYSKAGKITDTNITADFVVFKNNTPLSAVIYDAREDKTELKRLFDYIDFPVTEYTSDNLIYVTEFLEKLICT